ncbi:MAG TPA: energy-coupling factor transporter transmembrane component T [Nitrososphaerales archaeon]|jgi:energy-coupling factor transport system permease protein|nr:energy-coupling factor transporter transmembrane component T [Nitrososphaerales archaeon]|tara:strand:- start:204 stop:935 length:732 start_codon:yes stop_codon:yes gene_type:complete
MQWIAQGFIFRHTTSPFHQLDPRVKLLVSIELFTLSLLVDSLPEVIIALSGIFAIASISKILRRISRTLTYTLFFAIIIFSINILVGYPLMDAFVIAVRFLAIVGSTSIFFLTTPPDELELVMKWFRLPRDIVFAFVTAVRFVPVLMMDALQIMDAQKSRGLELQKGNIFSRFRRFIPILIPLIVDAVLRSGDLAEAMEARAYGAVKKPTNLYQLEIGVWGKVATILSIILIVPLAYLFLFLM